MIKITIAYPRVSGRAFDHDYFFNRHLPRLINVTGDAVKSVTVERGVDAPAWPLAEHELICSLECETRETFEAAFFPQIEALQDDMERCGGATPTIQVSEIVLHRAAREGAIRKQPSQLHHLSPPCPGGALAIATAG
jgi:uncharacterized protein (TIGR02118 family)